MNRRMRHVFLVTALTAALGLVWGMGDEEVGGDGIDLRHVERNPRVAELDPGPMNMDSVPGLAALYGAVADFADVEEATAAGYAPSSDCMAGDFGAQGIHYAKDALFVPSVVLETPQLLMYEPGTDGSLRFVGVEYLVFQQAWYDAGHDERPTLFGQVFGLNETLLDEPFYLLHVWVGQIDPSGL